MTLFINVIMEYMYCLVSVYSNIRLNTELLCNTWLVPLPTAFVFMTSDTGILKESEMLGMIQGEGIQEWFTSLLNPNSSVKHLVIYDFMWGSDTVSGKCLKVTFESKW